MGKSEIIMIIFSCYSKKGVRCVYVLFSVELIGDDYGVEMKVEDFELRDECMYKIVCESCVCVDVSEEWKVRDMFVLKLEKVLLFC